MEHDNVSEKAGGSVLGCAARALHDYAAEADDLISRSHDARPCCMVTQRKRGAVPTRSCTPAAIAMLVRHAAALWKGRRL